MRYKTVIFDFDGTICDTGEGILKSAKFALDYYNIEAPDYTELTYFIGPPLLVTFQEKFGVDAAMADKLVKKYSLLLLLQSRRIILRLCLTITVLNHILTLFAV